MLALFIKMYPVQSKKLAHGIVIEKPQRSRVQIDIEQPIKRAEIDPEQPAQKASIVNKSNLNQTSALRTSLNPSVTRRNMYEEEEREENRDSPSSYGNNRFSELNQHNDWNDRFTNRTRNDNFQDNRRNREFNDYNDQGERDAERRTHDSEFSGNDNYRNYNRGRGRGRGGCYRGRGMRGGPTSNNTRFGQEYQRYGGRYQKRVDLDDETELIDFLNNTWRSSETENDIYESNFIFESLFRKINGFDENKKNKCIYYITKIYSKDSVLNDSNTERKLSKIGRAHV